MDHLFFHRVHLRDHCDTPLPFSTSISVQFDFPSFPSPSTPSKAQRNLLPKEISRDKTYNISEEPSGNNTTTSNNLPETHPRDNKSVSITSQKGTPKDNKNMSDIPPQDEASHDKVKGSEPASPTGETQPDLINSSWSLDRDDIEASLRYHLERRKGLKNFYPDGPTEQHVKTATSMVEKLKAKGFLQEMALQMTWLIYYDMALLLGECINYPDLLELK